MTRPCPAAELIACAPAGEPAQAGAKRMHDSRSRLLDDESSGKGQGGQREEFAHFDPVEGATAQASLARCDDSLLLPEERRGGSPPCVQQRRSALSRRAERIAQGLLACVLLFVMAELEEVGGQVVSV